MSGYVLAGQPQGQYVDSQGHEGSSGTQRCRKRTAELASSASNVSSRGAHPLAVSSGADAAFLASLRVPRRWKAAESCFAPAAATAAAAAAAATAAAVAPQPFTLHRSAGSSTQLEELGREPTAGTAAGAQLQGSAFADPALTAAGPQGDAAACDGPQLASEEEGTPPLPPSCLLQRHESAQSSVTWLPALEDSPSSEPEVGQLRGVAARLQLRVRSAAQQHEHPVAKPSLREVAAFQHPLAEGSRRGSSPCRPHADIVCDVKFSPDGELIATAGVGKQIRAYRLMDALGDGGVPAAPVTGHRMPAKLSSLAWSPAAHGVITVGDYDGSVQQVHLETGHFIADADEHGGRRVWSVAHSKLRPNLTASAGDDGVVRLWHERNLSGGSSAMMPAPGIAACGVDFCMQDSNLLAVASADCNAYIYDLRYRAEPVYKLEAHGRALSYVRFSGAAQLVTASVDGTVKCWDLSRQPAAAGKLVPLRTYSGHRNLKNFVGLSVRDSPTARELREKPVLIACGSEMGSAHIYRGECRSSVAQWQLPSQQSPAASAKSEFISSVCWQPPGSLAPGLQDPLLAVAASDGDLRVLALQA